MPLPVLQVLPPEAATSLCLKVGPVLVPMKAQAILFWQASVRDTFHWHCSVLLPFYCGCIVVIMGFDVPPVVFIVSLVISLGRKEVTVQSYTCVVRNKPHWVQWYWLPGKCILDCSLNNINKHPMMFTSTVAKAPSLQMFVLCACLSAMRPEGMSCDRMHKPLFWIRQWFGVWAPDNNGLSS